MKKGLLIPVSILILLALMVGSFYGGILFRNYQIIQQRTQFFQNGNFPAGGNFPGNGQNGNTGLAPDAAGAGVPGGGGNINGQIKSIDGKTISLSTARNVTTVTMDDSTEVLSTNTGSASDLATGQRVIITGTRDSSGSLTAAQILIISQP